MFFLKLMLLGKKCPYKIWRLGDKNGYKNKSKDLETSKLLGASIAKPEGSNRVKIQLYGPPVIYCSNTKLILSQPVTTTFR